MRRIGLLVYALRTLCLLNKVACAKTFQFQALSIKNSSQTADKDGMTGSRLKILIFLIYVAFLSGCSVAGTEVKSLVPNFLFFKVDNNQIRINNLSELNGLTVTATCTSQNTGFEFDTSNSTPETWVPMPATLPSGIFQGVTDQCATAGTIAFTLDLSADFGSMTLGSSRNIKIKELNRFGFETIETVTVTYSTFDLSSPKRLLGQGGGQAISSGAYSITGQVTEISDAHQSSSGSYTLTGKATFQ